MRTVSAKSQGSAWIVEEFRCTYCNRVQAYALKASPPPLQGPQDQSPLYPDTQCVCGQGSWVFVE